MKHLIERVLQQKILILDGAMATMIQPLKLTESDFRDKTLSDHFIELKGNNDLLNITRPDVIHNIHLQYLQAGADILSTNTFGANAISQDDYKVSHLVRQMNYKGARLARKAVGEYRLTNLGKPLFVAGSIRSNYPARFPIA